MCLIFTKLSNFLMPICCTDFTLQIAATGNSDEFITFLLLRKEKLISSAATGTSAHAFTT